jgi:hypothetical protein
MKGLKFGHEDVAVRNRGIDTHKRPFFKATATALIAGLLYVGTPAAVLTMPNKAVAEETKICGRKVEVVKLEKTVAQMDVETAPFRLTEAMPEDSVSRGYINGVTVPGRVTFGVFSEKDNWRIVVAFPKELDKTSSGIAPGTRTIEINDFVSYVGKLSRQKMERAYIILEFGTSEYKGKNIEYVTAHVYPLNKDGQFISRMKDGDITFDVSYFDGNIGNGASLLVEPTNQRSTIAKQERIVARK